MSDRCQPLGDEAIRVGVAGVGRLGREHARIYRALPGVELAGVFDADAERARTVAGALGAEACPTLDDLLDRVQVVSVVVSTAAHAVVAERALAAGVHVMVEKPITATVAEADRLVARARERAVLLGVGHVERYGPAARAFLERVREPRFLECHRLAPFNPRGTDVPVVLDLMIHDLDMLLAFSRGEVLRVDAVGVPVLTPTADIANARLEFANGLIANLTASRVSAERMRKMRVFQPDAYLSLDYLNQRLNVYRRRKDAAAAATRATAPLDPASFIEREVIAPECPELLEVELADFIAALRKGGPAPVSGEDGRRALALAERIMKDMALRGSRPS